MADNPTIRYVSKTDAIAIVQAAKQAYTNQNAIAKVKVGETVYTADEAQDQIELVAGANMALSVVNGVITLTATDTTYSDVVADATGAAASGLMTSADKDKLDKVADGAEVNQNAFSNVKVGAETLAADAKTDTFELEGGSNITLSVTNDKITIAATDTTYTLTQDATDGHKLVFTPSNGQPVEIVIPDEDTKYVVATALADGLMSKEDFSKLDGIEDNAQANVIEGIKVGDDTLTLTNKVASLGTAAGADTAAAVGDNANLPTNAAVKNYVEGLGYQTKQGVKDIFAEESVGLYDLKGSVADYASLPSGLTADDKGAVYNVVAANGDTPAGTNYVWTGTEWDALGGSFDHSGFAQTDDFGGLTASELAEVIAEL